MQEKFLKMYQLPNVKIGGKGHLIRYYEKVLGQKTRMSDYENPLQAMAPHGFRWLRLFLDEPMINAEKGGRNI